MSRGGEAGSRPGMVLGAQSCFEWLEESHGSDFKIHNMHHSWEQHLTPNRISRPFKLSPFQMQQEWAQVSDPDSSDKTLGHAVVPASAPKRRKAWGCEAFKWIPVRRRKVNHKLPKTSWHRNTPYPVSSEGELLSFPTLAWIGYSSGDDRVYQSCEAVIGSSTYRLNSKDGRKDPGFCCREP